MARIRSIKPEFWTGQQPAWMHGYSLYVIQERKGPLKVGIASHPIRRASGLQSGNPRQLYLRAIYSGDRSDCRWVEGAILFRFADRAMIGEWLNAPLSEVISELDFHCGDQP